MNNFDDSFLEIESELLVDIVKEYVDEHKISDVKEVIILIKLLSKENKDTIYIYSSIDKSLLEDNKPIFLAMVDNKICFLYNGYEKYINVINIDEYYNDIINKNYSFINYNPTLWKVVISNNKLINIDKNYGYNVFDMVK